MEKEESQPITTPTPTKSKGPAICSALCIILALAGIGFGVYGMFFNKTSAPAKSDDNTSTVTTEVPTREKVALVLRDRFGLEEFNDSSCGGKVLSAGLFANDAEFDSLLKVSVILRRDYHDLSNIDYDDCNGLCAYKTISYAELNEKAHQLFGNSYDLAKEGYGTPYGVMGIQNVEYVSETDSFKVKYISGIGCAGEPAGYYANVVDVKASDTGFTATVSVLGFDASEAEGNGSRDYGDGILHPNININTVKTAHKLYSFDFIDEDGGYKLVNVTKK